jgi:hypothetical protein
MGLAIKQLQGRAPDGVIRQVASLAFVVGVFASNDLSVAQELMVCTAVSGRQGRWPPRCRVDPAATSAIHDSGHDGDANGSGRHLQDELDPVHSEGDRYPHGDGERNADGRAMMPTGIVSENGMFCLPGPPAGPGRR